MNSTQPPSLYLDHEGNRTGMYLDHEGNRTGDISPSWGQPNTRVHSRTIEAQRTPRPRGGGWYKCRFHASQWFAYCRHIFYFSQRKDMLKGKKAIIPDHQNPQPSICINKCTPIRSTCILCFSRSGFFRLSRCASYTWAHVKYPHSLCVCTCVYKHTPTHHPNTHKNREIYETKETRVIPYASS